MLSQERVAEVFAELRSTSNAEADSDAWQALRNHVAALVKNGMRDRVHNKLDASDIVQRSMMDVHQAMPKLVGDSAPEVGAWLTRLVTNNIIDEQRRFEASQCRNVRRETALTQSQAGRVTDPHAMTASAALVQYESEVHLVRSIAKLSSQDRYLLQLRHKEGMTFVQIGEELDITEQAARKRWCRILEVLKRDLPCA